MATTPSNRINTGIPMPKVKDAGPAAKALDGIKKLKEIDTNKPMKAQAIANKPVTPKPETEARRTEGGIATPNAVSNVNKLYRMQG